MVQCFTVELQAKLFCPHLLGRMKPYILSRGLKHKNQIWLKTQSLTLGGIVLLLEIPFLFKILIQFEWPELMASLK